MNMMRRCNTWKKAFNLKYFLFAKNIPVAAPASSSLFPFGGSNLRSMRSRLGQSLLSLKGALLGTTGNTAALTDSRRSLFAAPTASGAATTRAPPPRRPPR
jgi:hypothetical protein